MRAALVTATLVALGWLLLIIASPRWASPSSGGSVRAVAAVTYVVGSRICHQRPERSFRVGAVPMPVCARCTGLYLGVVIGLAVALRRSRRPSSRAPLADSASRAMLISAAVPTVATVATEWVAGIVTPPLVRLTLAVLAGGVAAWVCAERLATEAPAGR